MGGGVLTATSGLVKVTMRGPSSAWLDGGLEKSDSARQVRDVRDGAVEWARQLDQAWVVVPVNGPLQELAGEGGCGGEEGGEVDRGEGGVFLRQQRRVQPAHHGALPFVDATHVR